MPEAQRDTLGQLWPSDDDDDDPQVVDPALWLCRSPSPWQTWPSGDDDDDDDYDDDD